MGLRQTTHTRIYLSDKKILSLLARKKKVTEAQIINRLLNKK